MVSRNAAAWLLVCVMVGQGAPAWAQSSLSALPEAEQRRWATMLEVADAQLKQGDLRGAAKSFEQAKAIYADPRIARKLADVYSKLGQWELAEENLRAYAESLEPGAERDRAEGQLRALRAKLAELEVVTTPEAVKVSVWRDGQPAPVIQRSTPMEALELEPGAYRVTLEREGYIGREERVTLKRGERATLRVSLSQELAQEDGAPLATKILGTTGIVALGVGLGLVGYGAYNYYSAAPSGEGGLSRADANKIKSDGKRLMAIGGVTAGAGALIGGAGLLYWRLSDDGSSAQIMPGPGDVGVSVELRF